MNKFIELLKSPTRWEFMGNESGFEDNIHEHIYEICDLMGLPKIESVHRQRQLRLDGFQAILDIVVRHVDETATIFEVKKASTKHPATGTVNQMQGIGQLLLYQNMFEALTGGRPRLALMDNKIYERTLWAFANNNLPITLIELQKDRLFIPYRAW